MGHTHKALIAVYPDGRAAIAGLPGWSWPLGRCATGWVEAKTALAAFAAH